MISCTSCGGWMAPSQFADEPPSCMLCGRDGQPPVTYADLIFRTRASLEEARMLPPENPARGRPPGSKNKVRRIADTAPARADRSPVSGEIFDDHPEPARAAGGTTL